MRFAKQADFVVSVDSDDDGPMLEGKIREVLSAAKALELKRGPVMVANVDNYDYLHIALHTILSHAPGVIDDEGVNMVVHALLHALPYNQRFVWLMDIRVLNCLIRNSSRGVLLKSLHDLGYSVAKTSKNLITKQLYAQYMLFNQYEQIKMINTILSVDESLTFHDKTIPTNHSRGIKLRPRGVQALDIRGLTIVTPKPLHPLNKHFNGYSFIKNLFRLALVMMTVLSLCSAQQIDSSIDAMCSQTTAAVYECPSEHFIAALAEILSIHPNMWYTDSVKLPEFERQGVSVQMTKINYCVIDAPSFTVSAEQAFDLIVFRTSIDVNPSMCALGNYLMPNINRISPYLAVLPKYNTVLWYYLLAGCACLILFASMKLIPIIYKNVCVMQRSVRDFVIIQKYNLGFTLSSVLKPQKLRFVSQHIDDNGYVTTQLISQDGKKYVVGDGKNVETFVIETTLESAQPGSTYYTFTRQKCLVDHVTIGAIDAPIINFGQCLRYRDWLILSHHQIEADANWCSTGSIKLAGSKKIITVPIGHDLRAKRGKIMRYQDDCVAIFLQPNQWSDLGVASCRKDSRFVRGFPSGKIPVTLQGYVSRKFYQSDGIATYDPKTRILLHTASTDHGWSGGPIFSSRETVIGMHLRKGKPNEGMILTPLFLAIDSLVNESYSEKWNQKMLDEILYGERDRTFDIISMDDDQATFVYQGRSYFIDDENHLNRLQDVMMYGRRYDDDELHGHTPAELAAARHADMMADGVADHNAYTDRDTGRHECADCGINSVAKSFDSTLPTRITAQAAIGSITRNAPSPPRSVESAPAGSPSNGDNKNHYEHSFDEKMRDYCDSIIAEVRKLQSEKPSKPLTVDISTTESGRIEPEKAKLTSNVDSVSSTPTSSPSNKRKTGKQLKSPRNANENGANIEVSEHVVKDLDTQASVKAKSVSPALVDQGDLTAVQWKNYKAALVCFKTLINDDGSKKYTDVSAHELALVRAKESKRDF